MEWLPTNAALVVEVAPPLAALTEGRLSLPETTAVGANTTATPVASSPSDDEKESLYCGSSSVASTVDGTALLPGCAVIIEDDSKPACRCCCRKSSFCALRTFFRASFSSCFFVSALPIAVAAASAAAAAVVVGAVAFLILCGLASGFAAIRATEAGEISISLLRS
jgi:hypothetical protein